MNVTREIDSVISARLDRIQQAVFEASGVIEAVKGLLYDHHEEYVGTSAVIDLVNALRSALATLGDVTDRLDSAHLCNGSRAAVVRTETVELVDEAA